MCDLTINIWLKEVEAEYSQLLLDTGEDKYANIDITPQKT